MLRPRWRPCRGLQPSARAASWGCCLRFRVMAAFVRCHRTKTPCGRLPTEAEKSDGVTDGGPRGEDATDGATSRRHVRMMLGQRFAIFMHIRARILCSSGLSSCPCHDLGRETEKRCECPAWKSQSNVGLDAGLPPWEWSARGPELSVCASDRGRCVPVRYKRKRPDPSDGQRKIELAGYLL